MSGSHDLRGEAGERPDEDRRPDRRAPGPDARRSRIEEDVEREIAFHLEMREREMAGRGLDPERAHAEALRRFGDLEATRDACIHSDRRREETMTRGDLLGEVWRDAVVALRLLRRRPAFAGVAALTLAIGIGANTAIFSAVDHVLLRPLAFVEPERVVTLWETDALTGETELEVGPGDFVEWSARAGVFEEMGLAEPYGFDLTSALPVESLSAWLVTEGWLDALGVEPALGRDFLPEEFPPAEDADQASAVLVSHAFWTTWLSADPAAVGRTIELNGQAVEVVGVLPERLEYPEPRALWAPKSFRRREGYDESTDRTSAYMRAVARLRPGVTPEEAARAMDAVAAELASEYPATNRDRGVNVVPLRQHVLGDVRPALLVLFGAVSLVLLIASANVAGLLLARSTERARELSVRAALGAGRRRLTLQMLVESVVLAAVGGLAGIGVAWGGIRLLARAAPAGLPRIDALGLDGRVLGFAAGVTLLTALLFGLAPALRLSRTGQGAAGAGRRATGAPEVERIQRGLVVGEIALAMVLLIGAGLLGRSFLALTSNDLGFEPEGRAAIQLFLWDRHPDAAARRAAAAELEARMEALPGVRRAARVSALPFHPTQIDAQSALTVEGRTDPPETIQTTIASPGYFGVMEIPVLRGRAFEDTDRPEAPPVAVVNETLAKRLFGDDDPVGRRVVVGVMGAPRSREIVGVVGDVRPTSFDAPARAELFVPYEQTSDGGPTFVVETEGPTAAVVPALREVVAAFDPGQAIYHSGTVEEMIAGTLVARRFNTLLLGLLSLVAVGLATVGVYGLISFGVNARTAEIGVRMALGAQRGELVRMIVVGALRLALLGIALGIAAALVFTRFLEGMLYGVEAADPLTFVQLALAMLLASALAAWLPARRASRLPPVTALRE